jgi:hypothetical protein
LRSQLNDVLNPYYSEQMWKMNNEFDIIKNHKVYDENKPFELLLEKEI